MESEGETSVSVFLSLNIVGKNNLLLIWVLFSKKLHNQACYALVCVRGSFFSFYFFSLKLWVHATSTCISISFIFCEIHEPASNLHHQSCLMIIYVRSHALSFLSTQLQVIFLQVSFFLFGLNILFRKLKVL